MPYIDSIPKQYKGLKNRHIKFYEQMNDFLLYNDKDVQDNYENYKKSTPIYKLCLEYNRWYLKDHDGD